MAKKSLGYVHLEWICPNCATRNPGPQKTCASCGLPQPDNVQFEQPATEKIIADEATIAQATAGPDIHCHYCGTRNPATAATCSQCGANLAEGTKRAAGQVLGAHRDKPAEPVLCPACGSANAPDAPKCAHCGASLTASAAPAAPPPVPAPAKRVSPMVGIGLGVVALVLCAVAITCVMMMSRTSDLTGTVSDVSWQRTVVIEQLLPVTRQAWRDELPANSVAGECRPQLRRTQDDPAPNAREVCGTPYTVDEGTGYGEVVQDCQYEIYEDFCDYTAQEWQRVDEAVLNGNNSSPQWPALELTAQQRQGERQENYTCTFTTESGAYEYSSTDPNLLAKCLPGSRWVLNVNTFNAVVDIQPAN